MKHERTLQRQSTRDERTSASINSKSNSWYCLKAIYFTLMRQLLSTINVISRSSIFSLVLDVRACLLYCCCCCNLCWCRLMMLHEQSSLRSIVCYFSFVRYTVHILLFLCLSPPFDKCAFRLLTAV